MLDKLLLERRELEVALPSEKLVLDIQARFRFQCNNIINSSTKPPLSSATIAPSPAPALSIHKNIQKRRRVNSSSSTINNTQSTPKKQKLQPQITTSKPCNEGLGKGNKKKIIKILLSDIRNRRSRSELPKEIVHLLQKHIKLWDIGFARKDMTNWVTDLPKPRALPSYLFERMAKITTNWYLKRGKTYCG